ncbi:peptidase S8 and S53 subtilisin kexin sedolisin [Caldithrix abyssi DSM 13497]|uniref:Peptidase S8 and S53 subtilisin kexin sedolisin n=1 Tax=Caldithrix abyssi DSM 13497 TaxID=880073 RepID=H1XSF3_CALAY|nr:S8/S53 family peptidase [Caldithrix abyssi]APF17231.1 Por secretion system C-terminal sorting domain-containing protein [Caldithrix abyssi DSM 13497]EHO41365.1 peptidase S8 and S53 subtilisin kexin sedolisin [Caldithrix abyssi DSM 13497]
MRFFVLLFLSVSLLFAQYIDPYLTHLSKTSLSKTSEPRILNMIVKGDENIAHALYQNGFDVQSAVGEFATVRVPQQRINDLLTVKGIKKIFYGVKSKPLNSVAVRYQNVFSAYEKGYTGSNVIAGIIDTGIDFYHPMFIKNGQTRILAIWDQSLDGNPPQGYSYGTEFTEAQINQDLQSGSPYSIVNHHDTDGHGTHVAGSFVGADPTATPADTLDGGARDASIVVVKTTFQNADILDAINYIFDIAEQQNKPCVINISLGHQYGPHDGTDDFNSAVQNLVGPGRIVVRAAGNDGAKAVHYFNDTEVSSESIRFLYTDYLTLWLENGDRLTSVSLSWSSGSITNVTLNGHKTSSGIDLYLIPGTAHNNGKIAVYVFMDNNTLKNETFTLTLNGLQDSNGNNRIVRHAWADSSVFESPYGAFSQGTLYGNNFYPYTLSNDACNPLVVTVGAFITRASWPASNGYTYHYPNSGDNGGIASFSSIGPTGSEGQKPDVIAGGAIILSARSQDASYGVEFLPPAPYTDHYAYMQGTSMASPVASGAIALLLEKNPDWGPNELFDYLHNHAQGTQREAGVTADELKVKDNPNTWDRVFGYGAIDLNDAFVTDINEQTTQSPETFALLQNYPNPFNPLTTIEYYLPKTQRVTLRVYNARGQLIQTLVEGQQFKGTKKIVFNASNLASGIYFYRLKTEQGQLTRKMVLIK